jgi:GNAT superfamily N-acetyltransferase
MTQSCYVRTYAKGDEIEILKLMSMSGFERDYQRTVEHWLWKYECNPFGHIIGVAEHNGRLVGSMGLTIIKLKIGDQVVLGSQAVDLLVHPKFRRQGIFLSIGRFLQKEVKKKGIVISYVFPNEQSRLGFLKYHGYFDVGNVPRLVKPVNMSKMTSFFEENRVVRVLNDNKISSGVMRILLQTVFKVSFLVSKLFIHVGRTDIENLTIRTIELFDDRFDDFWNKVSKEYSISVVRDRRYLNWRYFECPNVKYTVLVAERKGEVSGYVVLRCTNEKSLVVGHIVDLLAPLDDKSAIRYIITKAIDHFKEKNVDLIVCWMLKESSSARHTYKILRSNGFIPIFGQSMSFIARASSPKVSSSSVADVTRWYITQGDSDQI